MKTNLFFLIISLCTASIVAKGQLSVGPAAGGQMTWTKFDNIDLNDSYRVSPVFGYHAGATVSLKVRNRFFLHGSLLYATKGRIVEGRLNPLLRN